MVDLQARIGRKATKLHSNLTWKRPGVDLQSPPKNTVKRKETPQNDEKGCDGDDPGYEQASSRTVLSPNKASSDHRSSPSRRRKSSGQLSLLSRMGLGSGVSEQDALEGEETERIQQSLLPGVGTDTPPSRPNIGSTWTDTAHLLDANGYHDVTNKHAQRLSQPSRPSTLIGQVILQDSAKFNYIPSNKETTQTRLQDNLATEKNLNVPNFPSSQEQEFEEGEIVDSKSFPTQQVRDLLMPLVLINAAHRVKESDGDLSRHIAHSVLSDEVCSSFMDQMKAVRTEMHAHKNRSLHDPPQMQLTQEVIKPGVAHASSSSKIGQAPPLGPRATNNGQVPPSAPRAMNIAIKKGKYMPPNGEIATNFSSSKELLAQPISALSSHSHDPVSLSIHGSRELAYYRPPDSSRHMARSRSPITLPISPRPRSSMPRHRWSPAAEASQSTCFRGRPALESPEEISAGLPPGISTHDRMPERRQSLSRDFKRMEGNISPHRDRTDPPQSPVFLSSRRQFGRRGANDKVVSSRRPSFTQDRGIDLDKSRRHRKDSYAGNDSEFARRSASPPRRKQDRQISMERPWPHTPPRQPATPNQLSQNQAALQRRREPDDTEMSSPGIGSMPNHLTNNAAGSHHPIAKLMVIDDQVMHERMNEAVGTVGTGLPDDTQKSESSVLPCHNVPGVWFVKVALDDIGTLECSFEVDEVTALKWNLRHTNVNLPQRMHILGRGLQLQICCLSQKHVQSVMDSLKPDATAQDVATAMLTIDNDWPTPGNLIIMVNPQDKNKKIWLPDKLEPPYLPVCIEDCVFEGQNTVQFIQLSGMSERMFVLFATARPLLDGLQLDAHEEFVPAPLQHTIDGGKGHISGIEFGKVTISDLR